MKTRKRGISPVIATVLLVGIAIVAFVFIFAWMRGFVKESVSKFGEPIENSCQSMAFEAYMSDNEQMIYVNNQGNVPIYGFNVEKSSGGSVETEFVRPDDGNIYAGESDSLYSDMSGYDSVKAIPVLLGEGEAETSLFPCTDRAVFLK